jgi:hypothetical protein
MNPDLPLSQTLVLAVRKNYWASPEAQAFPNRLYTRKLFPGPGRWGSQGRNPLNNLTVILEGLRWARRHKTRLVIIGSASRAAAWFGRFRRWGWLPPETQLLAISRSYLDDREAHEYARIVVFARSEITAQPESLRRRHIFLPLPADGPYQRFQDTPREDYIFAGGGAGRDFPSLMHAVDGLPVRLHIATFSPRSLGWSGPLPANCQVTWTAPVAEFLEHMARARFVVAPLQAGWRSHGQTTVVQAICLGQALVSTRQASVEDYIGEGENGLLVEAGDVAGYRQAILRLLDEPGLLAELSAGARRRAPELTYAKFTTRLAALCAEVIA